MDNPCELIAITRTRACDIWMCEDCRTVHVGIGPVSLRLKLVHFLAVVETLLDGAQRIRVRQSEYAMTDGSHYRHH